jgi:hypothetical protein
VVSYFEVRIQIAEYFEEKLSEQYLNLGRM